MSADQTGSNKSSTVLAQAFPQLGAATTSPAAGKQAPAATRLQSVPPATAGAGDARNPLVVSAQGAAADVSRFWNVPVTLTFEVAYQNITLQQLMTLSRGAILPLQNVYVDAIKVKVGEKTIARAEAISLKKRYGMRVSEIAVPPVLEGR